MTYLEILNLLTNTALAQPNVNTVVREFLHLNREDTVYSAVVIQDRDGDRTIVNNQDYLTYTWHIGYVDRLTDDESNRDHIFSTGINIINNIVNCVRSIYSPYIEIGLRDKYSTFNQRFTASCAGVYVVVYVNIPISECEDYDVNILSSLNATIVSNGSYHYVPDMTEVAWDNAFITVAVPIKEEERLVENIISNGSYNFFPQEGKVFSDVSINVSVPLAKEEVTFDEQVGFTGVSQVLNIVPPSGKVFSSGTVTVDGGNGENINENVTQNGQYHWSPGSGVDYYKDVLIEVSVPEEKPEVSLVDEIFFSPNTQEYTWTPDPGKVYSSVAITYYPGNSENINENITQNGQYVWSSPGGGIEYYQDVSLIVDVHPSQSLVETISSNGIVNFSGEWSNASITVSIPEETLSETITSNGSYHYDPSTDCLISSVDITVSVPSTTTVSMDQSDYVDLSVKDPNTIYLING